MQIGILLCIPIVQRMLIRLKTQYTVRASCKCNEFINERDINCTYECAEIQNNVACFSDMHDVCLNSFRFLSRTRPKAHQSIKYK